VLNGRAEPYRADAAATLKLQVRSVHAAHEILLNGQPLGTIPADTPNETTLSFDIPSSRLAKVNRVTVRADTQRGPFDLGPIELEYKKNRLFDPRYAKFENHYFGTATSAGSKSEKDFYFCLPCRSPQ
jgi:hypothetical protein